PANLVSLSRGSWSLLVQVKAVLHYNVAHEGFDRDLKELLPDDLAPAVRRRGRHAFTPSPKADLREAEPDAFDSSTSGFCLLSSQTRRTGTRRQWPARPASGPRAHGRHMG